eukprot:534822-Hanusia_phi.AAC.1
MTRKVSPPDTRLKQKESSFTAQSSQSPGDSHSGGCSECASEAKRELVHGYQSVDCCGGETSRLHLIALVDNPGIDP